MPDDFNTQVIEEFRANGGAVGGNFAGAPVTLLHHVGRKSGKQSVAPVMYLPDDDDSSTVYVFASKAGAPTNPAWYYNMTTAGTAQIEIGDGDEVVTWTVDVQDLTGDERDRVFAEQARRYPGFADYERKTAGVRTIPVLALHRRDA